MYLKFWLTATKKAKFLFTSRRGTLQQLLVLVNYIQNYLITFPILHLVMKNSEIVSVVKLLETPEYYNKDFIISHFFESYDIFVTDGKIIEK